MPKVKCSNAARLHKFILEFDEDVFSTDGLVILCKICGVKIASEKNFFLKQHIASGKHVRALQRKETQDKATTQIFILDTKKSSFNEELCQVFLSSNIPLNKLNNVVITYNYTVSRITCMTINV